MFGKKKEKIFFFENNKKESVQLEHENVTELVLVTLRNGIEEGERFSNRTRKRIQWLQKKLNEEPYEVKISCTVL